MSNIKEGVIRQSTDNPISYELRMLSSGDKVVGKGVVRRNDMIYVTTDFEPIPVYAFKMNSSLMALLKQKRSAWDG